MKKRLILTLFLAALLLSLWAIPALADLDDGPIDIDAPASDDGPVVINVPLYYYKVDTQILQYDGDGNTVEVVTSAGDRKAYAGETVKLIYHPAEGYELKYARFGELHEKTRYWSPVGEYLEEGPAEYSTFTMPEGNVYIYIKFGPIGEVETYELIIPEFEGGIVTTKDGRTEYEAGELVSLEVLPLPGYYFESQRLRIYTDPMMIINFPTLRNKFNMFPYKSQLEFVFSRLPQVMVNTEVNPEGVGTVTGGGLHDKGFVGGIGTIRPKTLTATSTDPEWMFLNWTMDGEVLSTKSQYPFVASDDCTVVANFIRISEWNALQEQLAAEELARAKYPIWVGGVQVPKLNPSGDGWSYDPDTATLTLRNADITGNYNGANIYIGSGTKYDINRPLTIRLEGKNRLRGGTNYGILDDRCCYALKITGSGSLTIEECSKSAIVYGDNCVIDGPDILIFPSEFGIRGRDITIKNAKVRCSTKYRVGSRYGFQLYGKLTIQDSTLIINGVYMGQSFCGTDIDVRGNSYVKLFSGSTPATSLDEIPIEILEGITARHPEWDIEEDEQLIIEECNDYIDDHGSGVAFSGQNISVDDGLCILNPAGYTDSTEQRRIREDVVIMRTSFIVSAACDPGEGGTVTSDRTDAGPGETVALTVTPAQGWKLDGLTVVDGAGNAVAVAQDEGDPTLYRFAMPASDVSAVAAFARPTYGIAASAENGTVTPDLDAAAEGETVTLTLAPQAHYELESLTVSCGESGALIPERDEADPAKYTFAMPVPGEDVRVHAVFRPRQYTITLETDPARGTLTADKETAAYGETVTLQMLSDNRLFPVAALYVRCGSTDVEVTEVSRKVLSATYTFVMPDGNVLVNGNFSERYIISFENWNGRTLQWTDMAEGEMPVYEGPTPETAPTEKYVFTFEGWDKEIVPVTGHEHYRAVYTAQWRSYNVDFVDYDGTVLESAEYVYGATPDYTGDIPARPSDAEGDYEFSGWTPQVDTVKGDAVYTAVYKPKPHLKLGETQVSLEKYKEETFPFEPAESGYYYISSGHSPVGPSFDLLDDEDRRIDWSEFTWYNHDTDFKNNFALVVYLEGGREYKLALEAWRMSGEVTVSVEKKEMHRIHYDDSIPNGEVFGPEMAYMGQKIMLWGDGAPGYALVTFDVVSAEGEVLEIGDDFRYTMPDCDLNVTATFAEKYGIAVDFGAGMTFSNGLTLDCADDDDEFLFYGAVGTKAEIKLRPWDGYRIDMDSLSVVTADGRSLPLETTWKNESLMILSFTMPAEAVTVTAHTGRPHKVSFAAGDGRGLMSPEEALGGKPYALPACEFVAPAGKAFIGWQVGDDAEDLMQPGETIDVWNDVTLLARWAECAFGSADFTLPAGVTRVEREAFAGIAASAVYIPDGCAEIGEYAFRDCPNLVRIRVPADCRIGLDAFAGCGTVYVFGEPGSRASVYCMTQKNCVFVEAAEE